VEQLPWRELAKAGITAVVAGWLSYQVARLVLVSGNRIADLKALGLIAITWAGAVAAGLWLTRSELPGHLRRRRATPYPRVAERQAEELSAGIEP
jgi:hypothetical protein